MTSASPANRIERLDTETVLTDQIYRTLLHYSFPEHFALPTHRRVSRDDLDQNAIVSPAKHVKC